MNTNKIIVAGGTGFIGKLLIEALVKDGFSIVVITRDINQSQKSIPIANKHIEWSNYEDSDFIDSFEEAYGVINLSGASIADKKWTKEYKEVILKSRVSSTNIIANTILKCKNPPKVLINASAVGYYGDTKDSIITENSPNGNDFLALVCKRWEESALIANTKSRVVLARIGLVLSKTQGAFPKLVNPYKLFVGAALGTGKQWMPWIHIDDLISIFAFLLKNENIEGAVNLTSPNPVTMSEFSKILGKSLSRPSFFKVPSFILKLLLGESAAIVLSGSKVLPEKALKFGFKFKYDKIGDTIKSLINN